MWETGTRGPGASPEEAIEDRSPSDRKHRPADCLPAPEKPGVSPSTAWARRAFTSPAGSASVSYTHLDVYKIQGLTQRELAEALHLTDKAVSKWERGLSYPDVTVLEPLAERLHLTVGELMACRAGATEKEEPVETLSLIHI